MLAWMASRHPKETRVGDKSPKSKEKGKKQKNAAEAQGAASAKSKQDSHNRTVKNVPGALQKGKK